MAKFFFGVPIQLAIPTPSVVSKRIEIGSWVMRLGYIAFKFCAQQSHIASAHNAQGSQPKCLVYRQQRQLAPCKSMNLGHNCDTNKAEHLQSADFIDK